MALLAWASVIIFFAVALYKIVKVARAPLGVRWEVYPVPHEEGEKRHYGGSYMEEVGWAKSHKKASVAATLIPELLEIGAEVLVLKRVRAHNRFGIWPFSMCMHWGIYLTVAWVGLLVLDVIVGNLTGFTLFSQIALYLGPVAFSLGIIGAAGLAVRRASRPRAEPVHRSAGLCQPALPLRHLRGGAGGRAHRPQVREPRLASTSRGR